MSAATAKGNLPVGLTIWRKAKLPGDETASLGSRHERNQHIEEKQKVSVSVTLMRFVLRLRTG
jgi:hypothetical protein